MFSSSSGSSATSKLKSCDRNAHCEGYNAGTLYVHVCAHAYTHTLCTVMYSTYIYTSLPSSVLVVSTVIVLEREMLVECAVNKAGAEGACAHI